MLYNTTVCATGDCYSDKLISVTIAQFKCYSFLFSTQLTLKNNLSGGINVKLTYPKTWHASTLVSLGVIGTHLQNLVISYHAPAPDDTRT